jgi:hypothetical protein
MDFEVSTVLCAQKSRNRTAFNCVRMVRIYQSVQPYFVTIFEEGQSAIHRPYRMDSVQVRTVTSWHGNRDRLLCEFSGKFGMVSKEAIQPLMHLEICCSC